MTLVDVTNARSRCSGRLSEEERRKRSRGSVEAAPVDFVCPLTRQVMRDPGVLSSGHSFERSAVDEWLSQFSSEAEVRCPASSAVLASREVVPNHALRRAIGAWKNESKGRRTTAVEAVDDEVASDASFGDTGADEETEDLRAWADWCLGDLEHDAYVPLKVVPRDVPEAKRRALAFAGVKGRLLSWISRPDTLEAVRGAQLFALYHALPGDRRAAASEAACWRLSSLEAAALAACVRRGGDEALATMLCVGRLWSSHNKTQLMRAGVVEALLDAVEAGLDDFALDLALRELRDFAEHYSRGEPARQQHERGARRSLRSACALRTEEKDPDAVAEDIVADDDASTVTEHNSNANNYNKRASFDDYVKRASFDDYNKRASFDDDQVDDESVTTPRRVVVGRAHAFAGRKKKPRRASSTGPCPRKRSSNGAPFARCSRVAGVLMTHCEKCCDDEQGREDERKNQSKILATLCLAATEGPHDVLALLGDGRVVGYAVDALRSSLESEDAIQFDIGNAAFKLVDFVCQGGGRAPPQQQTPLRRLVAAAAKDAVVEADGLEAVWARVVALRRAAKDNKRAKDWDAWVTVNATSSAVQDAYRLLKDLFAALDDNNPDDDHTGFEANVRALAEDDDFVVVDDDDDADRRDDDDKGVACLCSQGECTPDDVRAAADRIAVVLGDDGVTKNAKRRYSSRLAESGGLDVLCRLLRRDDCRAAAAAALASIVDASDVCDERASRAVVSLGAIKRAVAMLADKSPARAAGTAARLLRALTDLDEFDQLSDDLQRDAIIPDLVQRLAPATLAAALGRPEAREDAAVLVSNCARARRDDADVMTSHPDIVAALVRLLDDPAVKPVALEALADVAFESRICDDAFDAASAVPALANIAREEVQLPKTHLRPALTALAAMVVLHEFAPPVRPAYADARVADLFQDLVDFCDDGTDVDLIYRRARSEKLAFYQTALAILNELQDVHHPKIWCDSHNSWLTPREGLGWSLPDADLA
ncbi:hypothetical protein CTAYLR_000209 [Chrysophaeum taylorii]|uniref:RING-type E3 ubiquitin transferase n=1 Tax=Chrysophaeum taylorii TaxID=2483200 RepID=A0AAD7UE43_9STRA|nr:hypothetical protein CTAYLR_000209 [Chrysophaeum taylorii]